MRVTQRGRIQAFFVERSGLRCDLHATPRCASSGRRDGNNLHQHHAGVSPRRDTISTPSEPQSTVSPSPASAPSDPHRRGWRPCGRRRYAHRHDRNRAAPSVRSVTDDDRRRGRVITLRSVIGRRSAPRSRPSRRQIQRVETRASAAWAPLPDVRSIPPRRARSRCGRCPETSRTDHHSQRRHREPPVEVRQAGARRPDRDLDVSPPPFFHGMRT